MKLFIKLQLWIGVIREIFGWENYERLGVEEFRPQLSHEYETIPATNWSAVYRSEDGENFEKRPLIAWQLTYCDDIIVSSDGLVFVENKPPFVESACDHPSFIGYEREVSTFEPYNGRLGHFDESLNEWG